MMTSRACIRGAIKWSGVAVCALVAAAWVGSAWLTLGYFWKVDHGACIESGRFVACSSDFAMHLSQGTRHSVGSPRLHWWFDYENYSPLGGVWFVAIPLWFPLLLALIPTIRIWRLDARARRLTVLARCTKCCYDLTGLAAAAPCPECGQGRGPNA